MSIRIADCTIRDGGYLLNKNSNPDFVKGILKGLADAGIDFAETGFLQKSVAGETIVYNNTHEIEKYIPSDRKKTSFLGFCDNSRYSIDKLNECSKESVGWIRISFAKHEIDQAIELCINVMKKGYHVQCNPMDAVSYGKEEWISLIDKVNRIKPDVFSIVDTFGAMYLNDLDRIYCMTNSLLDGSISIGLHSHDNLGLSCALAERLIDLAFDDNRDVIIDGSLFGMGRGAGNAKTELLADYVNKRYNGNYNIDLLLKTIDAYITPLLDNIEWGYDLPMYVCGTMHAHVDNVFYMKNKYHSTANELYAVLGEMSPENRTRYGVGYSKTDFSSLDKIYRKYKGIR